MVRLLLALSALGCAPLATAHAGEAGGLPKGKGRDVVLVANAEGGTVSIVDARTLAILKEINVVPDGPQATPGQDDLAQALLGQRIVEAAGGTNLAQDQDVSPDGRTLYVSRGHRGDIAAFDIATGTMLWKLSIPGLRSDHMTISRDGGRLYVSALTEGEVEVVDTQRRAIVGSFPTGDWPHDNHLSDDGLRVYNGSIGNIVADPVVREAAPPDDYVLTVADTRTLQPVRRLVLAAGLRPFVLDHDERRMYAQLSHLHGVVEVDLQDGRELRRLELPVDPGVTDADYDFEAPHHGLAMSHDGRTLCAAGRASDYVALVSAERMAVEAIIEVADAPGWAATGPDGRHCFVPSTRADMLSVISYRERREVARIKVGDGPKQIEAARLDVQAVCPPRGCEPQLALERRCLSRGRLRMHVTGDVAAVRRVIWRAGSRVLASDRSRPFVRVVSARAAARVRGRLLVATIDLHGSDRTPTLTRRLPRCGR